MKIQFRKISPNFYIVFECHFNEGKNLIYFLLPPYRTNHPHTNARSQKLKNIKKWNKSFLWFQKTQRNESGKKTPRSDTNCEKKEREMERIDRSNRPLFIFIACAINSINNPAKLRKTRTFSSQREDQRKTFFLLFCFRFLLYWGQSQVVSYKLFFRSSSHLPIECRSLYSWNDSLKLSKSYTMLRPLPSMHFHNDWKSLPFLSLFILLSRLSFALLSVYHSFQRLLESEEAWWSEKWFVDKRSIILEKFQ